MPLKDIVVIGASTGGIEATRVLASELPRDFRGSIFVVVHIGRNGLGLLPEILERTGPLPASNAKDGEPIKPGHIYVAPPDYHLVLEASGHVRLTRGPKENRTRPAVDPLFRSAAQAFGPRVIGVILTGELDDGTAGLWSVKAQGGTTIVQDPVDALAPSMPLSALRNVSVDYSVPLNEIASLLSKLTATAAAYEKGTIPVPERVETEVSIAKEANAIEAGIMKWGEPSIYACPECHGVLLQLKEGSNLRFRCHTGHAYSLESLLAELAERTEESTWSAIRSMEETASLMRQIAEQLSHHHHDEEAKLLQKKAREALSRADSMKSILMARNQLGKD